MIYFFNQQILLQIFYYYYEDKFEDTKGVIRNRKSGEWMIVSEFSGISWNEYVTFPLDGFDDRCFATKQQIPVL